MGSRDTEDVVTSITNKGEDWRAAVCRRMWQKAVRSHMLRCQRVVHVLQDCAVLGDIVAQELDSVDAALERYERQRKPDVHALGTMDHQVRSCDISW